MTADNTVEQVAVDRPRRRIAEIQGLRAIAIGMVMAYHFLAGWTMPIDGNLLYPETFASTIAREGWMGVQLFFMISGFVIALTLQSTPTVGQFARKRIRRLVPSTLVALPLVLLAALIIGVPVFARTVWDLMVSITLVDPWIWNAALGTDTQWVTSVMWTLWVEVQFYVLAALTFYFARRRFIPALVTVGALLWAREAVVFITPDVTPEWIDSLPYTALGPHFWWFFSGVMFHRIWQGVKARAAVAACAGLVVASTITVGELMLTGRTIAAVMAVSFHLIFGLIIWRPAWWVPLRNRWLLLVGGFSYELYLIHDTVGVSIIWWMNQRFGDVGVTYPLSVVLATGASLLIAHGIWTLWSVRFQSSSRHLSPVGGKPIDG
jgi:peptidoglycan/LPS O-acetylase OafA/YrhL